MSFTDYDFPTPKSWDKFEDIVCDAAKLRWNSPNFFRNGRSGQPQAGVDVYATDSPIGIQCKKLGEVLTKKIVLDEIKKAETFQPVLTQYYIATTAPRDEKIQTIVRTLSAARKQQGKFSVHLLFWDDIFNDLDNDKQKVQKHFPQFFRDRVIAISQKSADWLALCVQRDKLKNRVRQYPNDTEFQQDLSQVLQQMEDFKRDVLKLAEEINKLNINTERGRLAKAAFEAGDYQAARQILNTEEMAQEQTSLLERQQHLQTQQAEVSEQLANSATEYVLKAQLTAIDYSLPDRIEQTKAWFEAALKSARKPEHLLSYAKFLQDNNQFSEAEQVYREALPLYRHQAQDDPTEYQPKVAVTLNNLGCLVAANTEAENLLGEALEIYFQLAQDNPTAYHPYVAKILNNLGKWAAADSLRRVYAENLYDKALEIYRQLPQDNLVVYYPYLAMTLNNLGVLVAADSKRHAQAKKLYREALKIRLQLSKNNSAVRCADVAETLSNLANLVYTNNKKPAVAEKLCRASLKIRLQLSEENPEVYRAKVADTLNNLGNILKFSQGRRAEAEKLYLEALAIYRQLAQINTNVYLPEVAMMLNNLGAFLTVDTERHAESEKRYLEALEIRKQLAQATPSVHLPSVANTLSQLGVLHGIQNQTKSALAYFEGAAYILAPFAEKTPELFGERQTKLLQTIEELRQKLKLRLPR